MCWRAATEELDGYTVEFTTFREDADATPFFKGLPDDRCQSPHWGYVMRGRLTFRYADRDEVYEAGDAYYAPPGHIPVVTAGTEVVEFSPTEEYAARLEVARAQPRGGAGGLSDGRSDAHAIDTTPVDLRAAAAIEAAEARAWADLYAAAPADWAASAGLGLARVGGALVLRWAATGRRYFSRAIGLGVVEPASRAAIDEILERLRARPGSRCSCSSRCRTAGRPSTSAGCASAGSSRSTRRTASFATAARSSLAPPARRGELTVERVDARRPPTSGSSSWSASTGSTPGRGSKR